MQLSQEMLSKIGEEQRKLELRVDDQQKELDFAVINGQAHEIGAEYLLLLQYKEDLQRFNEAIHRTKGL